MIWEGWGVTLNELELLCESGGMETMKRAVVPFEWRALYSNIVCISRFGGVSRISYAFLCAFLCLLLAHCRDRIGRPLNAAAL